MKSEEAIRARLAEAGQELMELHEKEGDFADNKDFLVSEIQTLNWLLDNC